MIRGGVTGPAGPVLALPILKHQIFVCMNHHHSCTAKFRHLSLFTWNTIRKPQSDLTSKLSRDVRLNLHVQLYIFVRWIIPLFPSKKKVIFYLFLMCLTILTNHFGFQVVSSSFQVNFLGGRSCLLEKEILLHEWMAWPTNNCLCRPCSFNCTLQYNKMVRSV